MTTSKVVVFLTTWTRFEPCSRSHPTERFVVDLMIVKYEYVIAWYSSVTDEACLKLEVARSRDLDKRDS